MYYFGYATWMFFVSFLTLTFCWNWSFFIQHLCHLLCAHFTDECDQSIHGIVKPSNVCNREPPAKDHMQVEECREALKGLPFPQQMMSYSSETLYGLRSPTTVISGECNLSPTCCRCLKSLNLGLSRCLVHHKRKKKARRRKSITKTILVIYGLLTNAEPSKEEMRSVNTNNLADIGIQTILTHRSMALSNQTPLRSTRKQTLIKIHICNHDICVQKSQNDNSTMCGKIQVRIYDRCTSVVDYAPSSTARIYSCPDDHHCPASPSILQP